MMKTTLQRILLTCFVLLVMLMAILSQEASGQTLKTLDGKPAPGGIAPPVPPLSGDWQPGINMTDLVAKLLTGGAAVVEDSEYGFHDTAFLAAFIAIDGESVITVPLEAGVEYCFVGAGDDDATDIDISVETLSGKVVTQDTETDNTPVVFVTPLKSMEYTIRLQLYEGKRDSFCGLIILRDGGWDIPQDNLSTAIANCMESCAEQAQAGGDVYFADEEGEWAVLGTLMQKDESHTWSSISLRGGEHRVVAGGDTQAEDLDLAVYREANGGRPEEQVASDTELDGNPVVSFDAKSDELYRVEVENYESKGPTLVITAVLEVL
jgi:hypothetical protein